MSQKNLEIARRIDEAFNRGDLLREYRSRAEAFEAVGLSE
jgi:hypothetical protein